MVLLILIQLFNVLVLNVILNVVETLVLYHIFGVETLITTIQVLHSLQQCKFWLV